MKVRFFVTLLIAASPLCYSEPIDDAIKSSPLIDAPGSKTPLGKQLDSTTVVQKQQSIKDENLTVEQKLLRRVEHLETENSILLDRIKMLERSYSDLTKKVKTLEEKSDIKNPRRIIRPQSSN